jgi:hypothetical protein
VKAFFFEKKKQKTFDNWCCDGGLKPTLRIARIQKVKSFLLLFFKKEGLCFLALL